MPGFALTESEALASVDAARRALAEDLAPTGADPDEVAGTGPARTKGDITSAPIFVDAPPVVEACFVPRQGGVIAGTAAAAAVFESIEPPAEVIWRAVDGDVAEAGDHIGVVRGPAPAVLLGERSALNLLCHLSGVASLTARYVAAVRAAGATSAIRDTRKTTPGLRLLEKAAVRAGGGVNHRLGLSDGVLIKDNHLMTLLDAGEGVAGAVARIRSAHPGIEIEVEAETLAEVEAAISAGANVVLCDNMPIDLLREAVAIARGRVKIEASGGINLSNVAEVASSGVDYIAVGALTHSAPALDIGLDMAPAGDAGGPPI